MNFLKVNIIAPYGTTRFVAFDLGLFCLPMSHKLNVRKLSSFNIVDKRTKFYSQNTNLLPPKPKSSFRHLKQGIQEFHWKYVLVPADKAVNNVVVV